MWLFKSEVFIELGSDLTIAAGLMLEIITQIRKENLSPYKTPPPSLSTVFTFLGCLYDKLRVCQSDQKGFKLKTGVMEVNAKPTLWH